MFLLVSSSFASNTSESEKYHGSDLKDLFLEDEQHFVDHISRFEVSALYSFYSLSTSKQSNNLSTSILSDFSSGFSLRYNIPFSMKNVLSIVGEYQRVIFQAPDSNELSDNNEDLFQLGALFTHSFSDWFDGALEIGGESRFFLNSIADGNAEIKSVMSPYVEVVGGPKVKFRIGSQELQLKLDIGYKRNLEAEQGGNSLSDSDTYLAAIKVHKKINKTDYEFGLEYNESSFKTNQSQQEISNLALSLKISL
jgi:hypothetical protein